MQSIGNIQITWVETGEVECILRLSSVARDAETSDWVLTLGAIALVDHALSTLRYSVVVDLCEAVLTGLLLGNVDVNPIAPAVSQAQLDINGGKSGLFTIFKPGVDQGHGNSEIEDGIAQLTKNYLARALLEHQGPSADPLKFGVYGVVSSYEHNLRKMKQEGLSTATVHKNIRLAVSMFINRYPYGIREEDLRGHLEDIRPLIERWSALGLDPNRNIFGV